MMNNQNCGSGQRGYPSDCELTEALRNRAMFRNRPLARSESWQAAMKQASRITLLLLDVDGVLTDGTITYSSGGGESKSFHTQDGLGIRLVQEVGIQVGIITGRSSEAVSRRAEELQLDHVYQGKREKLSVFEEILKVTGFRPPQIAFMGDDLIDLPILNRAGLSAAPANAVPEIKQRVQYVTERSGGHGAVRELCDLLLEARGQLEKVQARFDR